MDQPARASGRRGDGERKAGHLGLRARPAERPHAQRLDQELTQARSQGHRQRFSFEDAAVYRERAHRHPR